MADTAGVCHHIPVASIISSIHHRNIAMTQEVPTQRSVAAGVQKMTPSEAFVETLVVNDVTDIFGIMGSVFMDAMDIFKPTGTPLELIAHIAALVPPPRTHRHRYFGVLAPNSPLRASVTAMAVSVAEGVVAHHFQIGTHIGRKVGLVDHQQIAFGDAGAAFTRNFLAGKWSGLRARG
jgi:hypothetical protein